jgi:hypothetical protein
VASLMPPQSAAQIIPFHTNGMRIACSAARLPHRGDRAISQFAIKARS